MVCSFEGAPRCVPCTQCSRAYMYGCIHEPDAHVALQVTASLCFKIWGYVLRHGVPPGFLERRSVCGARAAPSLRRL